jgi:Flp pilus assembly protein TadB
VIRRAIAAATTPRRPGRTHRADRNDRQPLRTATGLALAAAGLICTLAVHVHTSAINVQTAGIITMALGLAWLWNPARHQRAMLRRQFDRAMTYLAWDPGQGSAVRCSLDDLLKPDDDETGDCTGG